MSPTKTVERIKIIRFPVFVGYAVHIIVTDDVCASRRKRDHYFGEPFEGTARALHAWGLTRTGESWLFFHPLVSPGTVAHESWHAIYRMMKWAGAGIDNEIIAYHLGYLVHAAWHHIRPKGRR